MSQALREKRIVLGVSGGIAAYKAADLVSRLRREGAEVRVAMTASAERFVGALTFEALAGHPVGRSSVTDGPDAWRMDHIGWAKWADAFVIAPATADTLARLAHGLADDAVTALHLAWRGPLLLAPAMNAAMWDHAATRANVATLAARGAELVGPDDGALACGDTGPGRMAEPAAIVQALAVMMARGDGADGQGSIVPGPWAGRRVLITSGPTHEAIDPVRYLSNPSTGRLGAALAREAAARGAKVRLVTGPVAAEFRDIPGVETTAVVTALQMDAAVRGFAAETDVFIFSAAVGDYRAAAPSDGKLKRDGRPLTLELLENPDIAAGVGASKRPGQVTVGFAAETADLLENAAAKLTRKNLDVIVANAVDATNPAFGATDNAVTILTRDAAPVTVTARPKAEVARAVLNAVEPLLPPAARPGEGR